MVTSSSYNAVARAATRDEVTMVTAGVATAAVQMVEKETGV